MVPPMRRAVAVIALVAAISTPARATPPDLFGLGPRTQALAMTGASYADDYEAVYANPAGLARARRVGIHLGLSAASLHLTVDGVRDPVAPASAVLLGATLPLPLPDVLADRLVLGVAASIPTQGSLRAQVFDPEVLQWPVLDRTQSMSLLLGLGADFHATDLEGLRIGLGLAALVDVVDGLDVRSAAGRTAAPVDTQVLASFSPIAGISYERDQWSGGLVYRHEVRSELRTTVSEGELAGLEVGRIAQYDPPQLAAEISFRPDPDLRIVANVTVRFWSVWPGAEVATAASSNLPSSALAPAPQMSDTVSPRLAIEGTIRSGRAALTLRGGYALELSPAPAARLAPLRDPSGEVLLIDGAPRNVPARSLDSDRHVVTAGLGVLHPLGPSAEGARLRLDLFAQAHLLADRTHTLAAPGAAGTGMSSWMTTGGFVLVGGWNVALEL